MNIHVLEHEPLNGATNIDTWAAQNQGCVSRTFLNNGEKLPRADQLDWLIIAGGEQHVWEEDIYPWLKPEKEFISEIIAQKKMVLGICFGAQLLAEQLGGDVRRQEHSEIGWHHVTRSAVSPSSNWRHCLPPRFVTFHWHYDCFSLPPGTTHLADSEASRNQAFASESLPVLGLQFHPEFTRNQISRYARECGDDWRPGPYEQSKAEVLAETSRHPDTYWLMERIMDHMASLTQ